MTNNYFFYNRIDMKYACAILCSFLVAQTNGMENTKSVSSRPARKPVVWHLHDNVNADSHSGLEKDIKTLIFDNNVSAKNICINGEDALDYAIKKRDPVRYQIVRLKKRNGEGNDVFGVNSDRNYSLIRLLIAYGAKTTMPTSELSELDKVTQELLARGKRPSKKPRVIDFARNSRIKKSTRKHKK